MYRKTFTVIAAAMTLSASTLLSGTALAAQDYSKFTNEEMVQIRQQIRNMSEADRAQFQAEMRKRMQSMSMEERQKLGLNGQAGQEKLRERINEDNDQGKGDLSRDRKRLEDSTGMGQAEQNKLRERINEDSDEGKGELERDRIRNESEGYGSGFGSRPGAGAGGGGRRGR